MARTYLNWSRTERCTPVRYEEPASEAAVVALVKTAAADGLTVRVVGARHSWSDIAMGDGVLVSLDRMQEVIEVDRENLRVRLQAGIRLTRLNEELAAVGLALPILGSIAEQSIAGVLSTGTHGSSLVHGNVPSFVVGMRLVTGTGEVLDLGEEDPLLPAARVALGAFGVITEVTIEVVPAFKLVETTETIPFARAVEDLESIARSAEYVKLWWLPHTEGVIVFRCERTEDEGAVSPVSRWIDKNVVNAVAFPVLLFMSRVVAAVTPPINRVVALTYLKPRRTVGRSDRVLTLPMPPLHREMEYSVPLDRAAEALRQARALIDDGGMRVNFIVEARFVRADDNWMSPATGRDSCQLGAYMARAADIERYFEAFQTAMKALDGRPHWGKEFQVTTAELATMYPRFEAFRAKARELDPERVFRSRFLDRLFED